MVVDPISAPHKPGTRLDCGPRGRYTIPVPASRDPTRAPAVRRRRRRRRRPGRRRCPSAGDGSGRSPTRYRPFAGRASSSSSEQRARRTVGPFYVPDPFGGDRSILLALEDGKVVALSGDPAGNRELLGSAGGVRSTRFVDCNDVQPLASSRASPATAPDGLLGRQQGDPPRRPPQRDARPARARRPTRCRRASASGAHASSRRFSPTSRKRTTASALSPLAIDVEITPSPNFSWRDVVADAQAELLRAACAGRPPRSTRRSPTAAAATASRCDDGVRCEPRPRRGARHRSTCTSSSGISARNRLGGW